MRATLERGADRRRVRAHDRRRHAGSPTGCSTSLDEYAVPWSIVQLGARAEYRFAPSRRAPATSRPRPRDDDLDEYLHLYMVNRGVLITPFHNMALMCPDTTAADVDLHTTVFAEAIEELRSQQTQP